MGKTQKNEFNISGKVLAVHPPEVINERLRKSELILEIWFGNKRDGDPVLFEFKNELTMQTANVQEGDWVNIDFSLRGRAWTPDGGKTRWFNSLEGLSCTVE